MQELGKVVFDELKTEEKRTVTLEIMEQALSNKKYNFLNGKY